MSNDFRISLRKIKICLFNKSNFSKVIFLTNIKSLYLDKWFKCGELNVAENKKMSP